MWLLTLNNIECCYTEKTSPIQFNLQKIPRPFTLRAPHYQGPVRCLGLLSPYLNWSRDIEINTLFIFLNLPWTDVCFCPESICRCFNTQHLYIWGIPFKYFSSSPHTCSEERACTEFSKRWPSAHRAVAFTRQNCLPDIHLELPASRTVRNTFQPASVFCYSSLS